MRTASPRARWGLVLGAVLITGSLGFGPLAAAQDAPTGPAPVNPVEPTGRAVCNLAFTLAGAVGLANFVVPPGAPLGPNEIITALRPILSTCVGIFPPAPPRRCFTSDLYPNTGLPLTLPDPVGIVTEQLEAVAAVLDPLGLALKGPLHDVFSSALQCKDPVEVSADDDGAPPADDEQPVPATDAHPDGDGSGPIDGDAPSPGPALQVAAPTPTVTGVLEPVTSLVSNLPEPLRGPAVAASVAFVVAGAVAARRLLSPRRPS